MDSYAPLTKHFLMVLGVTRTVAPSPRIAALVVACEDDDVAPFNLKQDAVRKSAKYRLPDIAVNDRESPRCVFNGGQCGVHNMGEVLAKARYITFVPLLCIEQLKPCLRT